jgi:hypothetical protein
MSEIYRQHLGRFSLTVDREKRHWRFGAATWPWGWCWMNQLWLGKYIVSVDWLTKMKTGAYYAASASLGWFTFGWSPWVLGLEVEWWPTYQGWMGGISICGASIHAHIPLWPHEFPELEAFAKHETTHRA